MIHPRIAHTGANLAPVRPSARALCALRHVQMMSRTSVAVVTSENTKLQPFVPGDESL